MIVHNSQSKQACAERVDSVASRSLERHHTSKAPLPRFAEKVRWSNGGGGGGGGGGCFSNVRVHSIATEISETVVIVTE